MLYIESDSIGPILSLVEAQVDAPHSANIQVGRKGHLFTICVQDEGAHSDDKQP
jgi:hypothetical protein